MKLFTTIDSRQKPKKNRRLLRQVGGLFILLFFILFLISSGVEFSRQSGALVRRRLHLYHHALDSAVDRLESYRSFPWLEEYWSSHADRMDLNNIQKQRLDFETLPEAFREKITDTAPKGITEQDMKTLSAKGKKDFAEYCYLEIQDYCTPLYGLLPSKKKTLYCFLVRDDHTLITLYKINSHGSDTKVLGKKLHYLPTPDQDLQSTEKAESPDDLVSLHLSFKEDGKSIHTIYQPIVVDGKACGIVAATIDEEEIILRLVTYLKDSLSFWLVLYLISGLLLMVALTVLVLHPIAALRRCVVNYANTHDAEKILTDLSKIPSRNEVGLLADDFSGMIRETEDFMHRITDYAEKEHQYVTELKTAANIQASFLPHVTGEYQQDKRYDIAVTMTPAKDVGGDLYDFFYTDHDHLVLIIADVSGKGVPAALFMMRTKAILQSMIKIRSGLPLSEMVSKVNDSLCEVNPEDMFVTTWVLVVELSTGRAVEVNAGHTKPALCQKAGAYELVKNRHSLALGSISGISYRENTWQLSPGDRLFVYTDGVPEAENADEEQFGYERMLRSLNENITTPNASQEEVLATVHQSVKDFVGETPPFDDLTMLGFTYYGC